MSRRAATPAELAWREHSRRELTQRSFFACVVATVLVAAGLVADQLRFGEVHPGALYPRLVVIALLLIALSLHFSRGSLRHGRLIAHGWLLSIQLLLIWVVALSGGQDSPYAALLVLPAVFAAMILPLRLADAITISAIMLAGYVAAALIHATWLAPAAALEASAIGLQLFFFGMLAMTICIGTRQLERARRTGFVNAFELERQNERLASINRMKSDFVANVSHELRTPLTMLLAPIEDIDRSPLVRNTENEPRARIAKKNAQQLLALVDNLLEVIRLREVPETPPTTPVHLSDQLESFCEMAAYQAERRGIRIDTRIAPEVWVRGNTDALEKVLYNLIGNALKYAQSEGEIRIELAHEDGSARLVVSDTGPGIRDEVLPQVLARFRRGHVAGDRDPGGSGIGLALSRELIEAMGGHLEIASEYGRGTRVSVSLRSSPPAAPAAMPPPPGGAEADAGDSGEGAPVAARDVGRGRVLIVDDNPEVRHYIAATLAEEFDCLSVGTAEETLAAVHREPFDLILLDWILGGDDGLALAGAIREGRTDTHTRIVILSARSDRDSALLALREGADEFIAKPFGTRELLERVRNIVRTVRLEREIVARNTVLEQMIEQLNATQEQLVHSEKMNALGRLSAGLLHEVRNPLNYVSMATQVLKRSPAMRDAAEAREILTDIEEGVNRVSAIVSDLKEFSHPSAVQFADTPVAQIVDSALKFTRHEAGAIVLGQRVEAGLHAHCSQPHVVQVLVNLLANAIRSLQGDTRVQAPEIEISASRRAEGWIEIRVCDNGRGMDEAALDQVFEPFYTTATAGSGIGMGLPICQTIITRHGGVIRAESIPYVRTCFTFTLPASAAQAITESVNEAG